ncbi:MAG: pectinesterase family protein [Lysobacterales bacterium]
MRRRELLSLAALAPLLGRAAVEPELDAWVSHTPMPGGAPTFASVSAAIAAAPIEGQRPFRIGISAGRWTEKLLVDRPHVQLIGAGRAQTILSFAAAAGDRGPDGEPWGTWGCASLIIRALDVQLHHLTVENAFDYVGHLYDSNYQPIGANGLQAVALMLDQGADRCVFEDLGVHGHQDTLFVDHGRSRWRNCRISGSVDFIFGAGQAVFERCRIHSRFRPGKPRQGYLAAPSTLRSEPVGLLFDQCLLQRDAEVPDGSVALGRPWRPTRQFADGRYGDPQVAGMTVYRRCWMDAHIDRQAWDAMGYTARDGSRQMLEPAEARFGEYRNHGPGAHRDEARPQLSGAANRSLSRQLAQSWDELAIRG